MLCFGLDTTTVDAELCSSSDPAKAVDTTGRAIHIEKGEDQYHQNQEDKGDDLILKDCHGQVIGCQTQNPPDDCGRQDKGQGFTHNPAMIG